MIAVLTGICVVCRRGGMWWHCLCTGVFVKLCVIEGHVGVAWYRWGIVRKQWQFGCIQGYGGIVHGMGVLLKMRGSSAVFRDMSG